jgi:hypothetical protein
MPRPAIADRVLETTGFTGTGPVTLGGAPVGYRTFDDAFGVGTAFYYCVEHPESGQWEVGVGVLADPTHLTRQEVLSSSAGGAAVSFAAGVKRAFSTAPADAPLWGAGYRHTQAVPSAAWTVPHGLGKRPSVVVVDSAGSLVEGEVAYPDDDTVVLTFSASFSGTAHLN